MQSSYTRKVVLGMQVYVWYQFTKVSVNWRDSGILLFSWSRKRNLVFFGDRFTQLSWPAAGLLPSQRFPMYRTTFRRAVVFLRRERFHSPSNTWPRVGRQYRPHRVVIFGKVGPCDMYNDRWIYCGHSTARIAHACWWVRYLD